MKGETTVATLWRGVLEIDGIDVNQKATKLMFTIQHTLGVTLSLIYIFQVRPLLGKQRSSAGTNW